MLLNLRCRLFLFYCVSFLLAITILLPMCIFLYAHAHRMWWILTQSPKYTHERKSNVYLCICMSWMRWFFSVCFCAPVHVCVCKFPLGEWRRLRVWSFSWWISLTIVFSKWVNRGLFFVYFRSFQANIIRVFTTHICEEMSIHITVPGFEPTTFIMWVSSYNH